MGGWVAEAACASAANSKTGSRGRTDCCPGSPYPATQTFGCVWRGLLFLGKLDIRN